MANGHLGTVLRHTHRLLGIPGGADTPDGQLLEHFAERREEGALAVLMQRHGPLVWGVCQRVLGNRHDAEDAFQATFLVFVRKAGSIRKRASVGSWLYQVAYRIAVRARAEAGRRERHEKQVPTMPSPDPLTDVAARELRALLDEELSRLPEKYREPLIRCALQGQSHEQAAQDLGCPTGSMSWRLAKGQELLRARLVRRGLTLPAGLFAALLTANASPAAVPRLVQEHALRAALGYAAGRAAADGASAWAVTLAERTLRAMSVTKLKTAAALLLAVSLVGTGTGLLTRGAPPSAEEPPPGQAAAAEGRPQPDGDPLPEGARFRLGTVRFRHPGNIHAVALAPDGKTLATAGSGTVRLWDAATGKPGAVASCPGDFSGVGQHELAFSPDGARVYFPVKEGVAALDVTTGQAQVVLPQEPQTKVHSVHPSPDGRLLAVGTNEGVQVVEWPSGRLRWSTQNGPDARLFQERNDRLLFHGPYSMALFAPDGKLVAVNSGDKPKRLRLLDAATGAERRILDLGARLVRLAFSPDGRQLAVTERDNAVRVYEVATGCRLHSWTVALTNPYENYTSAVAFSPDGATVAAGATDHGIYRWDVRTGRELPPLRGHRWYVWGLAFAAQGGWLYSVGWDGSIRRWDTATGQQKPVTTDAATGTSAWSPVGGVLAWEGDGGVLHLGDAATGKKLRTLAGNPAGFSRLTFSPDGATLAAGGNDLSVQLWQVASGQLLRQWSWPKGKDPHACVNDLAFTPDGTMLATAGFRSQEVLLWDVRTGARLARAPHEMAYGVVFTPDGRTLVSAGWDRALRWWSVPDLRPLDAFILPSDRTKPGSPDTRLHALARSPNGRLLATIDLAGYVGVWDATSHTLLHSFRANSGQCNVAFSPDGQWIATGGYEGRVALWETRTGQSVLQLAGHPTWVFSVVFSPDGRSLLTGSGDSTALVWDLRPTAGTPDGLGVAALWDALAGEDAPAAYRAVWSLADRPDRSVPFLKTRLVPVKPIDPERLRKLLDALGSDRSAERDMASRDLAALGHVIESELRRELEQAPPAEKRGRLRELLDGLSAVGSSEDVRQARAVVALKWANTPEARRLLGELAGGAPGARLTQEAKAALR
jgi:RNA polymerase sigma factor (sigma-70 family)